MLRPFHRRQGHDEHRAVRGQERFGPQVLFRRVELASPEHEHDNRQHVCGGAELRPATAAGDVDSHRGQQREVREQRDLCVARATDEQRSRVSARDGKKREWQRAASMRERSARHRDQDQGSGGCAWNDEREQVERSVGREIQNHDAGAGDEMSVALVSATRNAKAGRNHRDPRDCADRATRQRRDPRLLERVLQKERDAEEQHEQPGIQHPLSAEDRLEVRRWFRRCGGGSGRRWRQFRLRSVQGRGRGRCRHSFRDRCRRRGDVGGRRRDTDRGSHRRHVRRGSEFERFQPCGEGRHLALQNGQAPNGDEWDHEARNTRHGGDREG